MCHLWPQVSSPAEKIIDRRTEQESASQDGVCYLQRKELEQACQGRDGVGKAKFRCCKMMVCVKVVSIPYSFA